MAANKFPTDQGYIIIDNHRWSQGRNALFSPDTKTGHEISKSENANRLVFTQWKQWVKAQEMSGKRVQELPMQAVREMTQG